MLGGGSEVRKPGKLTCVGGREGSNVKYLATSTRVEQGERVGISKPYEFDMRHVIDIRYALVSRHTQGKTWICEVGRGVAKPEIAKVGFA